MTDSLQPQALSTAQVAQILGCHENTVRRRVRDGTLRSVRFGRLVLIPRSEVDRLVGDESSAEVA